jgi:hypothetical protein
MHVHVHMHNKFMTGELPDLPPLAPVIPAQPPVITTVQQHVAIRPPLFTSPYLEHRQLFGRRIHPYATYSGRGNSTTC